VYRQQQPNIIAAPIPQPGHRVHGRTWIQGYLDPYLNGAFAAPYAAWGPFSSTLSTVFWCFIIVLAVYMIFFGGPTAPGRSGESKYYYF